MSRYHVNPATGTPGPCCATQGNCPFGGEEAHHSTPEGARQAYEASMAPNTLPQVASARERGPYPLEGDTVVVQPGAEVFSNDFAPYVGAQGEVESFNGSSYQVRFPDDRVLKLNWQIVDFAPEAAAEEAPPYFEWTCPACGAKVPSTSPGCPVCGGNGLNCEENY